MYTYRYYLVFINTAIDISIIILTGISNKRPSASALNISSRPITNRPLGFVREPLWTLDCTDGWRDSFSCSSISPVSDGFWTVSWGILVLCWEVIVLAKLGLCFLELVFKAASATYPDIWSGSSSATSFEPCSLFASLVGFCMSWSLHFCCSTFLLSLVFVFFSSCFF